MKAISLSLCLLALSLFFSGCSTDSEAKAFFERGWKHPTDRDAVMGG